MSTLKADAITAVTTNGDVSISGNGSGGLNMLSGASATPFDAGTKTSGTFTPDGTITVSGFTLVDGDTATTTNGHDFFYYITKLNGFSLLTVKALQ